MSQIFGELIAVWACSVWQAMGQPSPFVLAELGPGRGTLMQDALRAARSMPGFLEAAQIHLVETSATLRERQDQLLSQFCRPQWHETVKAVPGEPLIVIANEFFDALPVEQHIYESGSWRRRVVSLNEAGRLSFSTGRLALPPVELIPLEAPREGDILEHRPAAAALIQEFGRRAQSAPFAMLIFDYGYERRDYGDTLAGGARAWLCRSAGSAGRDRSERPCQFRRADPGRERRRARRLGTAAAERVPACRSAWSSACGS